MTEAIGDILRAFSRRWVLATGAGAVLVSACDAVLLERSKGFFTGGFLSVDYLETSGQTVAFLAASFLVDAALIGLLIGIVALALSHTRLHPLAATFAGLLAATGLLVGTDVVTYGIIQYLGDAFDFALMFDLAGGSLREILAVTADHLVTPALVAITGGAVAGGLVWVTHKYAAASREVSLPLKVLRAPAALAMVGLATLVLATTSSDALENGLLRKPSGRALSVVVNRLTDVDFDGYGVVGRNSDPDLLNGAVFPYAADVPGNGIDEDAVGGDLPGDTEPLAEQTTTSTGWRRRQDVILVVLESFRADLVGGRLDGTPITPGLNALAARGLSVGSAYSHNAYTVQSRYHLLSGRFLPAAGGATLIDDFKANGYTVAYFSAQDESFGGAAYDIGLDRADVAYDARSDRARRYSTSTTPGSLAVPFPVLQERVTEFLQTRGPTAAPLFLYVNFHDTHFPYSHAAIKTLVSPIRLPREQIAPAARDQLWATYANTAANVDRAVADLLEAVRRARGAEPGIIVTADHGESLFDNGFLGHGYALNDAQTRVPLIVVNLPMELTEPFGQTDLRPALAAAMRLPADHPPAPTLHARTGGEVFQYLGDLSRPRQIGFLRKDARFLHDFRSQRVQLPDGTQVRPSDLPERDHQEFVRLVRQWERMKLAQSKH